MQPDALAAITNVVNLYAVALDARRYDLFADVFTHDVRCDFGGGAAWSGRTPLTDAFEAIHAGFSATQHIVSGHAIRVEGERARCLSYVHARFRRPLDGVDALFDSTGWYDDLLTFGADGWRIYDRASSMVSWTGDHRVMQAMPDVDPNFALMSLADEAKGGRLRFFDQR